MDLFQNVVLEKKKKMSFIVYENISSRLLPLRNELKSKQNETKKTKNES